MPASGAWTCEPASQSLILPFAEAAKIPLPPRRLDRRQALVQSPAVFAGRQPLHFPAPLGRAAAERQDPVHHAHVHRPDGRHGTLRARPLRRHLALHLARPAHILAWAWHPSHGNKFYLFQDQTDHVEVIGPDVMTVNGHCTYLPGNRWILNDTYPDKQREQNPYLYEVASGKASAAGAFSPAARIYRRVALRHAPALQPRRPQGGDRFGARRRWAGRCT